MAKEKESPLSENSLKEQFEKGVLGAYEGIENFSKVYEEYEKNVDWAFDHVDKFRGFCGGKHVVIYHRKIIDYQRPGEDIQEFYNRIESILESRGEFALQESYIVWVPPSGWIGIPSHLLQEKN